jgi:hypothetical protein
MPPHYLPKKPSHEDIKMPARKGFSEQAVPNNIIIAGNVLYLSDHSLLIFNVNQFFTWKDQKFTEVEVVDFPFEINSSEKITMVANSNNMFIYDHTTRDPEHNDFEKTTSMLLEGKDTILEMPCRLRYPILLANNTFLGIDDDNDLVECNPNAKKSIRTILSFDKKKISLYGMKDNRFLVRDETNLLSLYQLSDGGLIKINQREAAKDIKAIKNLDNNLDNNHFICSTYEIIVNETNNMKDVKTTLQLWEKDSLSCIQEVEFKDVIISRLMPYPLSNVLIGYNRNSIFIVYLEEDKVHIKENKIHIIDMDSYYLDLNIDENGNLVILQTDKQDNNNLIQIEPVLLKELINQSEQDIIHTHINDLRRSLAEEKTNSDVKDIRKVNGVGLFTPSSTKTSMEIDDEKEERKEISTGPQVNKPN